MICVLLSPGQREPGEWGGSGRRGSQCPVLQPGHHSVSPSPEQGRSSHPR